MAASAFGQDRKYGAAYRAETGSLVFLTQQDNGTYRLLEQPVTKNAITWLEVSRDGQTALFLDVVARSVTIWNVPTGQLVRVFDQFPLDPFHATLSRDGERALFLYESLENEKSILDLVDVQTGEILERIQMDKGIVPLATGFSDDRRYMVLTTIEKDFVHNTIAVWSVEPFFKVGEWSIEGSLWAAKLAHQNRQLISVTTTGSVTIWDTASGQAIRSFPGTTTAQYIAILEDRNQMLVSSREGEAVLISLDTGEIVRRSSFSGLVGPLPTFDSGGTKVWLTVFGKSFIAWELQPDLDALLQWALEHRYVRSLSCSERALYDAKPLCANLADQPPPFEPIPAHPSLPADSIGGTKTVVSPTPFPTFTPSGTSISPAVSSTPAALVSPAAPPTSVSLGVVQGTVPDGGSQRLVYQGAQGEVLKLQVNYDLLYNGMLYAYGPGGQLLTEATTFYNEGQNQIHLTLRLNESGSYTFDLHCVNYLCGGNFEIILSNP